MYELIFSEKAVKQLNKLELPIQERIIKVLNRVKFRPEAHVKKLVGDPGCSLRVGDYRVIVDIDRGILAILVIKIDHRKKVYKK